MDLPGDGHVHSEFSWDVSAGDPDGAAQGSMARMCARAERIGLPALAITDHLDVTAWSIEPEDLPEHLRPLVQDGVLAPPPFDAAGYHERIDRCRHAHPGLRILTGVEYGQPHLEEARARAVVDADALDRVNGSLHTIPTTDDPGGPRAEPYTLYRTWPAEEVIRRNLADVPAMLSATARFDVFCHLDYAARYWPEEQEGPFDPRRFEEEYRAALRAIAATERALEINTSQRIRPWIPQWWREEGGRAVTLASDAHEPDRLAWSFPEAAAMVEHLGFRPGRRPEDFWIR